MAATCAKCNAAMFTGETTKYIHDGPNTIQVFSLCCSYGSIELPPLHDPPDILKGLLTGTTASDRTFRDNIRGYNSSLAFASLHITGSQFKFPPRGQYCFHISGQIYHLLSQIDPLPGNNPTFSQIYIYDHEHE